MAQINKVMCLLFILLIPQRNAISQPMSHRLPAPIQGHVPGLTASSSKEPGRFPWQFQSNFKSLHRSVRRQVYCRTKSSTGLSHGALDVFQPTDRFKRLRLLHIQAFHESAVLIWAQQPCIIEIFSYSSLISASHR